ncbi:MAG: PfkB family carbohydrate kinase [Verrucomicrobiota bacterium]
MKEALLAAVDRFHELRLLVVGDVMLDIFDFCRSSESKPIDSEKLGKRAYLSHESVRTLGGAGNVAVNAVSLGAQVDLVGLVGQDGHRFTMESLAAKRGVEAALVEDPDRHTTTKTRLYIDDEYQLRWDEESTTPLAGALAETLIGLACDKARRSQAVILSDYAKGVFTPEVSRRISQAAADAKVPVVIDFKPANRALFEGGNILCPNETEAKALLPDFSQRLAEGKLEAAVCDLHQALRANRVVVTLGAKGICGFNGERFFHLPGHRVGAVDAVGCGDTVRVGLALGHALGLRLEEAAALANAAAAVIVQKPATACLSADELRRFISENIP